MTLSEYMAEHSTTADTLAVRLGGVSVSGLRKWLSGERQPDADVISRIEFVTGGLVTSVDMHRVRLAWLRANRPEKFSPISEQAA